MRLKVSFYGFALALIGFFVPLVIFAAFLPSLINAEPVKKRFIKELHNLTGAEVELAGSVAIESFFSLSLKAENVRFRTSRITPDLRDVKASQIVARISWLDLLSGNLDFDKIKIDDAVFFVQSIGPEEIAAAFRSLLTASHRAPFAVLVLTNSKIKIAGDANAEASEADISNLAVNIRGTDGRIGLNGRMTWRGENLELDIVTRAASPLEDSSVPLRLDIASKHLTGRFKGEVLTGKEASVNGQIEASTPDAFALSDWLAWNIRFDLAEAVRMSATLDSSGKTVHLRSGIFSAASEEASGDLNIALSGSPHIEGTLAFDRLDMEKFWAAGSGKLQDIDGEAPFARFLGNQNLDLRISANEARWKTLTLGSAAFTLTGRDGRIISEIARLDVFGGSIFGHIEADFRHALPEIKGRITAEKTDVAELTAFAFQSDKLTGRMDANIEFRAEGWAASQLKKNFKAEMRADFPEGGQMQLDLLQLMHSASAEAQYGWNSSALSWWAFEDARFKLLLEKNRLRFTDLILHSANGQVRGGGEIDLQERHLDWQLRVGPDENEAIPGSRSNEKKIPEASLFIQGPLVRPSIRLSPSPSRAGTNFFMPAGAHAIKNRL